MKKLSIILLLFMICIIISRHHTFADAEYSQSSAEAVMEVSSGRLLYSHNEKEQLPMASTTKIVTAITVIENCDVNSVVQVTTKTVNVEGSSVYLKEGDKFTVKDLLYGLMLRSGNDCAETLAAYCCGNIADFCKLMNDTAKKCGANDSNFENPHGLPRENHYTTAEDLCKITRHALQNDLFSAIVSTKTYVATEIGSGEKRIWKNKNKLLNFFDGANGVKTGYTKQAGKCFVGSATINGMKVISVVLNSPQMFERSEELLKKAFSEYKFIRLFDETRFDYVAFTPDRKFAYDLYVKRGFSYPISEKDDINVELNLPEILPLNFKIGESVGEIRIYCSKQLIFSENIYTLNTK